MKIRLTENKLKQIVAESVKNVLNEISSDLAFKASQGAYNKGRSGQGNTFSNYGNERLKDELSLPSNVDATNYYIKYMSYSNSEVSLNTNGVACSDGITRNSFEEWKDPKNENNAKLNLKVYDKRLARVIANWCSKYVGDKLPQSADWHFWAAL